MEPLRLDPADPLASVVRWLAALARALGLDPSRLTPKIRLNHAAASVVRRWLADWSRQLRALIRAEAARLAQRLLLSLGLKRCAPTARSPRPAASRASTPSGRMVSVEAPSRNLSIPRGAAPSAVRPAGDELIQSAEDAALRRRTRAVLAALLDPSAAVRRLALHIAKRLARAASAHAALRGRRRFPPPPRVLGAALRARGVAPEQRPPNEPGSAFRLTARPAAPRGAAPALASSA